MQVFKIKPIAKPRMTQRDKWSKRSVVMNYFNYKDELSKLNIILPESYHLHFILAMPKSWSKKKKALHNQTPHKQRPDKDNLEKGFLDALLKEDSHVWTGQVSKWWGAEYLIIIEEIPAPKFPNNILNMFQKQHLYCNCVEI